MYIDKPYEGGKCAEKCLYPIHYAPFMRTSARPRDWYNRLVKTFEQIRKQLVKGQFEFSRHAFRRAVLRNISENEIRQAAENAVVLEDYPYDKYAPSCLILGFTRMDRPLHIQVSYIDSDLVKIVTLYQPSESEWINFRHRR